MIQYRKGDQVNLTREVSIGFSSRSCSMNVLQARAVFQTGTIATVVADTIVPDEKDTAARESPNRGLFVRLGHFEVKVDCDSVQRLPGT